MSANTATAERTKTCAAPACGREFVIPRSWHGRTKDYCTLRCWTQNGPFGSARNGRLEEQHVQREVRPA